MDALEFGIAVKNDPRYKEKSLDEQIALSSTLFNNITRDKKFQISSPEVQHEISTKFLSYMPGYDPASVYGDDAESNRIRELYTQAEAIKTGQSDLNAWDGIVEGGRDWLSGKLVSFFADVFIEGDYTKALYGDKSAEAERYRDYMAEINDPKGMKDYEVGKVLGKVLGFGVDAVGMSALYGGIEVPGLIGKLLGQTGGKVFTAAMAKGGLAKAGAMLVPVMKQATIEGLGYVGETLVADTIIGQLDTNEGINDFVKEIPSTLGKGLMYFAFGESVGFALKGGLKGLAKVAKPSGLKGYTQAGRNALTSDEGARGFLAALKNPGSTPEELHALIGAKLDVADIKVIQQNAIDAQLIADSIEGKVDPDKVQEAAFRLFHGMDTEVNGDIVKIKSFNKRPLEHPVITKNTQEVYTFFKEQNAIEESLNLRASSKFAADTKGEVSLSIETKGLKPTKHTAAETLNMFGVDSGVDTYGAARYKKLADALIGEGSDVKIKVLDTVPRKAMPIEEGTIFIPKQIKNSAQASKVADDFFAQVEKAAGGKIKVDSAELRANLRGLSNVKYTKEFMVKELSRIGGKYKTIEHGRIQLILKNETKDFDNFTQAGAFLHSNKFTLAELQNTLKRSRGIEISYNEDGTKILGKRPGVKEPDSFSTLSDLFMDKNYRPGLPYKERSPVLYLVDGPGQTQVIKEGTIDQLSEAATKYEKLPGNTQDVYVKKVDKITKVPVYDTYRVTLGESGFSEEFSTLEKAKAFLEKDLGDYQTFRDVAYDKGWRVTANQAGGFTLLSPDKEAIHVKNLLEAQQKIASIEDLFNLPDMIDQSNMLVFKQAEPIAKQAADLVKKQLRKAARTKKNYKGKSASRFIQFLRGYTIPVRERLEQSGEVVAGALFDEAATVSKIAHNHGANVDSWLETVLHGKGRKLSVEQINNMGDLLVQESDVAGWNVLAKKLNIELTPEMTGAMTTLRKGMQVAGKMFGIDDRLWVKDYWTRLSKMTEEDAAKMAERVGGGGTGEAFFKNFRVNELNAAKLQNNAEHVFKTYMYLGLRDKYMSGTIEKITKTLADPNVKMGVEARQILEDTKQQLLGSHFSSDRARMVNDNLLINKAKAEKIMAREGRFKKWSPEKRIKKANEALHMDPIQYMTDLSTAAVMTGKMSLPIRNVSQINTFLAPLAGSGNVAEAMKELGQSDEFMARLYMDLHNKGIIKPRSGYSYDHGSVMNLVKNWNAVGLNNFYHSDDFTRMISSLSASNVFRNGRALLEDGGIDLKGFLKMCQTDYLGEVDQIHFTKLVGEGHLQSAETLLQRRWTEMTMLEYEQMGKPEKLHTAFGKLLGQFSTYPLGLVQFMNRGLKAEGPWFATKLLMGTSSTAFFYNQIMGMDQLTNWNPIDTVMFTGGPVLNWGAESVVNLGNLAFNPSPGGVKQIFKSTAQTFLPGYGLAHRALEGMEAFKEGEYQAAMVNALGSRYNKDMLIKN